MRDTGLKRVIPPVVVALQNHPSWTDFNDCLLHRLWGKLSVVQPKDERHSILRSEIEAVYREDGFKTFPRLDSDDALQTFIEFFLSYDPIEHFMQDPAVEDVMINGCDPVWVHKTREGAVKTDIAFRSMRELVVFVKKLHVFGGRPGMSLMSDVELMDLRGRANIISAPFGPQITITRGKPSPLTILDLMRSGMVPPRLAGLLWMYVEGLNIKPCNILIAGSTGSGKTTLLNAIMSFFHPKDRLVTIEDTLELNTDAVDNCSRMVSSDEISMTLLVKNSLRMRADRIIVGEVRGAEGQDLMTAMNLGKICMGTLHAGSSRETILRLENEPMNIPPVLVSLVDVIIIAAKLHIGDQTVRRVIDVAETAGMEREIVLLSQIWGYDNASREVIELSPSCTVRDRLAQAIGCPARDIMDEIDRRSMVLERMANSKGGFPDLKSVTYFCQKYIEDRDAAMKELDRKAP